MSVDASNPHTILLVEDQESLQALLSGALRQAGFTVLQAKTASEAERLSRERAHEIDLLITDEVMPGFSGVDLAVRMRGTRPDLKVICISGFLKEDVVKDSGQLVSAFLLKPFAMKDLLEAVNTALEPQQP